MKAIILVLLSAAVLTACTSEDAAKRGREAAEKIQAQIGDPQGAALAQKVAPERVKQAQLDLQVLREYLGDANGQLDSVTVNAVEAFQTSRGLNSNGMLTDQTMEYLDSAAKKKREEKGAS